VEPTGELAEWLEARGIGGAGACALAEVILAEGDEVTVVGEPRKQKRPPRGYRDETMPVLEGTAEAPILLRH
jgi:hypothetical protein